MPNKLWRTHPRNYGKDSKECRVCGARQGLITKYEMMTCRRCFREQAPHIGFVKVTYSNNKIINHIQFQPINKQIIIQ
ncbi:hypothetical protein ABPG74_001572 [Tetrahymena malaccensis]